MKARLLFVELAKRNHRDITDENPAAGGGGETQRECKKRLVKDFSYAAWIRSQALANVLQDLHPRVLFLGTILLG